MTRRITETQYIFANNQIIDSYKTPTDNIVKAEKDVMHFHKHFMNWLKEEKNEDRITIRWHDFYINIPVDCIETLLYHPEHLHYEFSINFKNEIKSAVSYYDNLITKINKDSSTMFNYQSLIEAANSKFLSLLDTVQIPETFSVEKQTFFIVHFYITLLPLLKQLKLFYYNIIFNQYKQSIYNINPNDLAFTSYRFIRERLHFECTNEDVLFKEMFYFYFRKIKDLKIIDGSSSLLNYKQKQELFKFIVYLKTYSKLVSKKLITNNSSWAMYHHRETKKYFHKFFGNNVDFSSYDAYNFNHGKS